jgi:hypothetical protein
MKEIKIASTVLFFLLFVLAGFANATPQQDEPKGHDASPAAQQPDTRPDAKPESQEQKPDEMKPEKQEKNDQDKNAEKQQEKEKKDQDKQEKKDEKNSGKEKDMDNMHGENQNNAHPAQQGGHIPDDKFHSTFGRNHTFHPSRPTIVNGRQTFVYGGYSFILVDPWPADWAYSDDCYVDYIDGEYFLFDLAHPGMRVALMVAM